MKKAQFEARKVQAEKDNIKEYSNDLTKTASSLFLDPLAEYHYVLNTYGKKYSVIIVNLMSRERVGCIHKGLSSKVAGIIAAKENAKSKHVKNPLYGFVVI